MSRYTLIFIILLLIFSCKEKIPEGFYVEKKYENGKINVMSKRLKDTLINDTIRNMRFSKIYDKNGNLIEEGNFIGNEKISNHLIYDKGKLKYIKSYYFISDKDDIFFSDIKIFGDSVVKSNKKIAYLNSNISIDTNKDTIFNKSTFVNVKFRNKRVKIGDSIIVNFTYYDAYSNINNLRIFIFAPDNEDLFDFIYILGNNYVYKSKVIKKGKISLNGFVIADIFDVKNSTDTIYGYKVYKLHKTYTVY